MFVVYTAIVFTLGVLLGIVMGQEIADQLAPSALAQNAIILPEAGPLAKYMYEIVAPVDEDGRAACNPWNDALMDTDQSVRELAMQSGTRLALRWQEIGRCRAE
jgi:hypothetical protein